MSTPISKIDEFEGVPMTLTFLPNQSVNSYKEVLIARNNLGFLNMIELGNDWHICNNNMEYHSP